MLSVVKKDCLLPPTFKLHVGFCFAIVFHFCEGTVGIQEPLQTGNKRRRGMAVLCRYGRGTDRIWELLLEIQQEQFLTDLFYNLSF